MVKKSTHHVAMIVDIKEPCFGSWTFLGVTSDSSGYLKKVGLIKAAPNSELCCPVNVVMGMGMHEGLLQVLSQVGAPG